MSQINDSFTGVDRFYSLKNEETLPGQRFDVREKLWTETALKTRKRKTSVVELS